MSWNLPEFGGDPVQDLSMVVIRKAPAMLENGTFYWRDQAFFSPAGQDQGWANDSLPEGSIQGAQGSFVGQWDGSVVSGPLTPPCARRCRSGGMQAHDEPAIRIASLLRKEHCKNHEK